MNGTVSNYRICLEDIPETYRDIAEVIGLESFLRLVRLCSKQKLYVPDFSSLERAARDRDICARFKGGNYRQLAVQFRLGERQVRKIVDRRRHRTS